MRTIIYEWWRLYINDDRRLFFFLFFFTSSKLTIPETQKITPRDREAWGSVWGRGNRGWQWGLQGALCCPERGPDSSETGVSPAMTCQPQQHAVPPEWQAGRCSGGDTGKERLPMGCVAGGVLLEQGASSQMGALLKRPWPWVTHSRAGTPPRDSGCGWPMPGQCWFSCSCSFFFSNNQSSDQKLALAVNLLSKSLTSRDHFACNKKLKRRAYKPQ